MSEPRHSCRSYFEEHSAKGKRISKVRFDKLLKKGKFADGPFRETFGDGYGEPYNPRRQAFGKLTDGSYVYTELQEISE